jgi:hypothetical protein
LHEEKRATTPTQRQIADLARAMTPSFYPVELGPVAGANSRLSNLRACKRTLLRLWTTTDERYTLWMMRRTEPPRQALSERHLGSHEERKKAMQDFVGICCDIAEPEDAAAYIQSLRGSDRMERIAQE